MTRCGRVGIREIASRPGVCPEMVEGLAPEYRANLGHAGLITGIESVSVATHPCRNRKGGAPICPDWVERLKPGPPAFHCCYFSVRLEPLLFL